VALNGLTPPELLARLAEDDSADVRRAVAGNPSLPVESADALLRTADPKLAEALARNEALPERIRVAARLKTGL
jgi:hypothetical protein